jgi:hypothetical protein
LVLGEEPTRLCCADGVWFRTRFAEFFAVGWPDAHNGITPITGITVIIAVRKLLIIKYIYISLFLSIFTVIGVIAVTPIRTITVIATTADRESADRPWQQPTNPGRRVRHRHGSRSLF